MEKIKNILSGHHSGEEVSNSPNAAAQPTVVAEHDGQATGTNAGVLVTDPEVKKHEHSILRQVVNPGGDKYDQEGYGITAHPAGEQGAAPFKAPVIADDVILRTDDSEKKHEHSILRQILNPGGAKYDQEGYGTTAHAVSDLPPSEQNKLETTPGAQKHEHSILRQILNPGGEKYDSQAHGVNADTVGHAAGVPGVAGTGVPAVHGDNASVTSIKDGVQGPYDQGAATIGSSSTAAPNTTTRSSVERDATLGGTAATAGHVAAPRPHKPEDDTPLAVNPIGDDVAVAGTGVTHGQAVQNQFSEPAAHNPQPVTEGVHQRETLAATGPTSINLIGDNTIPTGAGVIHGQAIQNQYGTQTHASQEAPVPAEKLHGQTSSSLANGEPFGRQYSGYIHRTQGPHPTDAGNVYDPSVPGPIPQFYDPKSAATGDSFPENHDPAHALGKPTSSAGTAAAVYGTDNIMDSKTEQKLKQAREEVAAEGGDRGEKKPSLIQRILHPGHKSHETHTHEHVPHSQHEGAPLE